VHNSHQNKQHAQLQHQNAGMHANKIISVVLNFAPSELNLKVIIALVLCSKNDKDNISTLEINELIGFQFDK